MERRTISSVRDDEGNDVLAGVELLRLAFPRRIFTLSQTEYVLDRVTRLYENRGLVGGLRFFMERCGALHATCRSAVLAAIAKATPTGLRALKFEFGAMLVLDAIKADNDSDGVVFGPFGPQR